MSTLKKVISIVLCLTMVFSTFAIAGDLFVPKASATVGESVVKTYAELETEYGSDFIYYAIDVMEYDADGNPYYTDHYVNAGDTLQVRHYIKMSRFMGLSTFYLLFDAAFFDLGNGGTFPSGADLVMNKEHEAVLTNKDTGYTSRARGLTAKYTAAEEVSNTPLTKYCGYSQEELDAIHKMSITTDKDASTSTAVIVMKQDTYFGYYEVKVKDGLADGTTGKIHQDNRYWKATTSLTGGTATRAISDIMNTPADITDESTEVSYAVASNKSGIAADKFITDTEHVFTIGENSDSGSTGGDASATVGESIVKSYAELEAEYGSDFIYYGVDVMEYDAEGNPYYTDHYVNAGDTLQIRHYIKMSRYMGLSTFYLLFDAAFFDLGNGGTFPSGADLVMNKEHEAVLTNKDTGYTSRARGLTAKYTAAEEVSNTPLTKYCGYSQEELDAIHKMSITTDKDASTSTAVIVMKQDTYFGYYEVKVKDDLADGTTGKIHQDNRYWKATTSLTGGTATRAISDIMNTPADITDESTEVSYAVASNKSGIAADKFITDTEHVFTIGANPAAGGSVAQKPSAIFVENDGTQISKNQYDEGEEVEIPASVDGQIGWANVATGEVVEDLTGYTMPKKTVTFKRVLSTDEFEITLDVDGGAIDTANLPEGVTANDDGTLSISAAIGETVSLANIAPTKTGYTGKWNPEEVTLDNINGATAKIEWTANTYNIKFYAEKGDESTVTNVSVTYNSRISNVPTVTKEGYSFVNWKSVADDSILNTRNAYTVAGDSAYYAEWSVCDSAINFMIMDYTTGEWKLLKSFYGNNGETLAKSELDKLRTNLKASDIGWDGEFETDKDFAFSTAIGSGYFASKALTYDGATQTIYVNTAVIVEVEWIIPVYDEANDVYGEAVETVTATVKMPINAVSSIAAIESAKYTPVTGYTLAVWNNADGEAVSNYKESTKGLNFTIATADGAAQKYTAVYAAAEYTVVFAIGDTLSTVYTLSDTVSKGDTIDVAAAKVVDSKGNEAELPTIGEVSDKYDGKKGNKLTGWRITTDDAVEFPVEITKEFIEANYRNGKLTFNAIWEPQAYDATFTYEKADGTTETFVISGITVGTPFKNFAPAEDVIAEINANAPEGKQFSYWGNNGPMTSGGRTFTAVYDSNKFNVYIDHGNGKVDENGNIAYEVRKLAVSYGDDAWAEGDVRGIASTITNLVWTADIKPEGNVLPTGWEIYHLDSDADLYDETKWKEGINDEGSNTVKSILVFRATWKGYNEFWFRVMDTTNHEYCALGKNFKMYYFKDGRTSDRKSAVLNPSDSTIVLLFKPAFEGGSLRFDPIAVPKSMFTVAGMTGIFRAIVDAIGSLIKGA